MTDIIEAWKNHETKEFHPSLVETSFVDTRRKDFNPKFSDPVLAGQVYALFTFIPSKGATPDERGTYGMIKSRGNFQTLEDANKWAETLVKSNAYMNVATGYVGEFYPVTADISKWCNNIQTVDVDQHVKESVSNHIKNVRKAENSELKTLKDRRKKLVDISDQAQKENKTTLEIEGEDEFYTTLRTKKAQLSWTYLELIRRLKQVADSWVVTSKEISEFDEKSQHFSQEFYQRFVEARDAVGIRDMSDQDQNFIKYMNEDIDVQYVIDINDAKYKVEKVD